MKNIYVYQSTQILMIKTFLGGDRANGYLTDSLFENFWSYDSTYGLDIDQYWESKATPDNGAIAISVLTFRNWTGTVDNGVSRGPIVIRDSDIVPWVDITLEDMNMWTENNNKILNQCKNVYGTGYCAGTSTTSNLATFTTRAMNTVTPAGLVSPTSPAWGVAEYGVTLPIPVYTPVPLFGSSSGTATAAKMTSTSKASASSSVSSTLLKELSSGSASQTSSTQTSTSAVETKASTSIFSSSTEQASPTCSLISNTAIKEPSSSSTAVSASAQSSTGVSASILSTSNSATTASAVSWSMDHGFPTGGRGRFEAGHLERHQHRRR